MESFLNLRRTFVVMIIAAGLVGCNDNPTGPDKDPIVDLEVELVTEGEIRNDTIYVTEPDLNMPKLRAIGKTAAGKRVSLKDVWWEAVGPKEVLQILWEPKTHSAATVAIAAYGPYEIRVNHGSMSRSYAIVPAMPVPDSVRLVFWGWNDERNEVEFMVLVWARRERPRRTVLFPLEWMIEPAESVEIRPWSLTDPWLGIYVLRFLTEDPRSIAVRAGGVSSDTVRVKKTSYGWRSVVD